MSGGGELTRAARSVRWRLVAGGWVAAALAGVIIALWSLHAGDWDNGLGWERTLLLGMHTRLPTVLDHVMLAVPWTGTNWSLFPIALIGAWRAARVGRGDIGVHLLTVTVGSAVLNSALKLAFDRPRPALWEHRGQHSQASFPSGHMIASISVLLTFALLLHRERGWRWPYLVVGVLTIVSIP
ncbi:MAG: phosphatase PAP2 family protein, partial [Gemmatimonadota bacterium]|nr:phosphatase PAP2 family protein [Gemmatimonadota bacterium]